MDDPALDPVAHQGALRGLARLNYFSRSLRLIWQPIRQFYTRNPRELRVLDIATGAGDLPIGLAKFAQQAGVPLKISACDMSPRALDFAAQRAQSERIQIDFFRLNALQDPIPAGFDIVLSSLFLHHLEEAEALAFLSNLKSSGCKLIVLNDLKRSRSGLWLAWLASRLLCQSPVVHADALKSAQGAFTKEEALCLAQKACLENVRIQSRWPCRFVLTAGAQ